MAVPQNRVEIYVIVDDELIYCSSYATHHHGYTAEEFQALIDQSHGALHKGLASMAAKIPYITREALRGSQCVEKTETMVGTTE